MVRYTFAIAGQPKDAAFGMDIDEKVVNIFEGEQLNESYLTKINAKAQVPALTSDALDRPIADSLDMTLYAAQRYPTLVPEVKKDEISKLLKDLHALNYFSLPFGKARGPGMAGNFVQSTEAKLAADGISDEYRKALEYRLEIVNKEKVNGAADDTIHRVERDAKKLMAEVESLLQPGKQWLYGSDAPSALDAHLVVFLGRMKDVKRDELISPRSGEYFDQAAAGLEWAEVMQGRMTMFGV